jgi:hypothetical protein
LACQFHYLAHFSMKMEAEGSSETPVTIYRIIGCQNTQYYGINTFTTGIASRMMQFL